MTAASPTAANATAAGATSANATVATAAAAVPPRLPILTILDHALPVLLLLVYRVVRRSNTRDLVCDLSTREYHNQWRPARHSHSLGPQDMKGAYPPARSRSAVAAAEDFATLIAAVLQARLSSVRGSCQRLVIFLRSVCRVAVLRCAWPHRCPVHADEGSRRRRHAGRCRRHSRHLFRWHHRFAQTGRVPAARRANGGGVPVGGQRGARGAATSAHLPHNIRGAAGQERAQARRVGPTEKATNGAPAAFQGHTLAPTTPLRRRV